MSRLLVVEADGDVSVRRSEAPDERSSLGEPAEGHSLAATCWAGGGLSVVSSHVADDTTDGRLVVHELAAGRQRVVDDVFAAFYLSPSPDGVRVANLAAGPLGLELSVLDLGTGENQLVERGQPLFWSWAPDGSALVVHVADVVAVVELGQPGDGAERTVLTEEAGHFVAPSWLPDGRLLYAVGDELVSRAPDGGMAVLLEGLAPLRFVVDADGRRIAYAEPDDGGRVGLSVLDVVTGTSDRVLEEATAGFFWDREGRRLAAVVAADDEHRLVRWAVWDGGDVERLAPFVPGQDWARRMLPFFEQYAQSHPVWSADGSHLVAAGRVRTDLTEILVQSVDVPSPTPHPLCPGTQASWAPT